MRQRKAPFLFLMLGFLALGALPALAQTPLVRKPGESTQDFAARVTGAKPDDIHIVEAKWNGRPFIFADYTVTNKIPGAQDTEDDRELVALEQMPDGSYRKMAVTTGEEEGDEAEIKAIGFAKAGKDPADDLIVLLGWEQRHADFEGTLYEVRIFADPGSNPPAKLTYLKDVSKHFDQHACDCGGRGMKDQSFAFKTMAAIKNELKKMHY